MSQGDERKFLTSKSFSNDGIENLAKNRKKSCQGIWYFSDFRHHVNQQFVMGLG
jgi:hypothetical protein